MATLPGIQGFTTTTFFSRLHAESPYGVLLSLYFNRRAIWRLFMEDLCGVFTSLHT
jgi:hypothetical protein